MTLAARFGDYSTASCTPPGRLQLWQRCIPRSSRTRSPRVPAWARQSPQSDVRNALLSPGIPAYPRLERKRQDRPVTPEVAGSSPVAPAQKLAGNAPLAISVGRPFTDHAGGRLHELLFSPRPNGFRASGRAAIAPEATKCIRALSACARRTPQAEALPRKLPPP
jgi:hypothetical protein